MGILQQGGLRIGDDEVIVPDPFLVGRNPAKLRDLSQDSGVERWTTDLDEALEDPAYSIYFDSQTTNLRVESVKKAIEAGKHVYCEKPTALSTEEALNLYRWAQEAGVKNGVVQDKLWLPGIQKLKALVDEGFFGKILSIRGEFGYWVFDGNHTPCQRPSWNYRKEDGGGIIFDMLPHWRYVLDNVFGSTESVYCTGATHVPERWDENGERYACTAEDSVYAIFELEGNIVAQFNSSWTVRVRRDDLLTLQVDGSSGSAVAGLRECYVQPGSATPRPVWNPDIESPINYYHDWMRVPEQRDFDNAFKAQWELFLRHVVADEPFCWDLLEGAKGVQLAERGLESWTTGDKIRLPDLRV
jgi:predicted dehydrogenase